MTKFSLSLLVLCLAGIGFAQVKPLAPNPAGDAQQGKPADKTVFVDPSQAKWKAVSQGESQGVEVRIKDIAHFRGVRVNQLTGFGLVIGLEGTGDTKKTPMTQTLLANMFAEWGTQVDPKTIDSKNVALVTVTCELPPFAKPGTQVDVRVSSIGDAKSLQGGSLLQTPLYPAGSHDKAYVVAAGAVSIGGFNASQGGNSVQRNHVNVGRVPDGGIVEAAVQTRLVFSGNAMYLELDQEDITTAQRVATVLADKYPTMTPVAVDGGTIALTLPPGMSTIDAMSKIEHVEVYADVDAKVIINERTGTIVIGGNVRIGPAAIAHGSLSVKIEDTPQVSQPAPFSSGTTQTANKTDVTAGQETSKIALVAPNATVADLAKILQTLELKPTDIIAILQALRQQGALKARIEIQ